MSRATGSDTTPSGGEGRAAETFVVLANSIRHTHRCIAGRVWAVRGRQLQLGPWVRPVSRRGRGEIRQSDCAFPNGRAPAVLDLVRVAFDGVQRSACQPENRFVQAGCRWQREGIVDPSRAASFEETPASLWLHPKSPPDRVPAAQAPASVQPFQSLFLIRPHRLRLRAWSEKAPYRAGPRKQRRALFAYNGHKYNLPITDPTMDARYFAPFPALGAPPFEAPPRDPERCLLTVSLAAPFEDGYCYKVVAAVLEY